MKLLTIILLVAAISFSIVGCGIIKRLVSSNEVVKRINSPNGKHEAIAFINNAGATTAYSPQVTLKRKWDIFMDDFSGNIFRGYHSNFIDIYWKDDKTLVIIHSCLQDNIFKQEKNKYGVNILYEFGQGAMTH